MAENTSNQEPENEALRSSKKNAEDILGQSNEPANESIWTKVINFFRQLFGKKPISHRPTEKKSMNDSPELNNKSRNTGDMPKKAPGPNRESTRQASDMSGGQANIYEGDYMEKKQAKASGHEALLDIAHESRVLMNTETVKGVEQQSPAKLDHRQEALLANGIKARALGWSSPEGVEFMQQLSPLLAPGAEISKSQVEDAYFAKTLLDSLRLENEEQAYSPTESELKAAIVAKFDNFKDLHLSGNQMAMAHQRIQTAVMDNHANVIQSENQTIRQSPRSRKSSMPNLG